MNLETAATPLSWVELAACRSRPTAWWFDTSVLAERAALAVCRRCPVRERCLVEARREEEGAPVVFGVRGGLTAAQRRAL